MIPLSKSAMDLMVALFYSLASIGKDGRSFWWQDVRCNVCARKEYFLKEGINQTEVWEANNYGLTLFVPELEWQAS